MTSHWFFGKIDFYSHFIWEDNIQIDKHDIELNLFGFEEDVNNDILDIMAKHCQNIAWFIEQSQSALLTYLQQDDGFIYFHRENDEYQNLDIKQCLDILTLKIFSIYIEGVNFIKLDFGITDNGQALCVVFDIKDEPTLDRVYWGEI